MLEKKTERTFGYLLEEDVHNSSKTEQMLSHIDDILERLKKQIKDSDSPGEFEQLSSLIHGYFTLKKTIQMLQVTKGTAK